MNRKQIAILIIASIAAALILWNDLPITFPWVIIKVFKLSLKLLVLIILAGVAFILVGHKRQP